MEDALVKVLQDTSEIDAELLDEETKVIGTLATDKQGLTIRVEGNIPKNISPLAAEFARIGAELEPENEEKPVIVLESKSKKLIVKEEGDIVVSILKKNN